MDDERHKSLFDQIKADCVWKKNMRFLSDKSLDMPICMAVNLYCEIKNCAPFQMCQYFNRPEIRRNK